MAGRPQWFVEEPRFTAHPYYDEWAHTFLEVNNFEGGILSPEARKRVVVWISAHCMGRVYVVGNRVSFMETVDAMAFQLTWG